MIGVTTSYRKLANMDEQERIPVQSGNARERGGMGGGVAGDGGQGKTKDKSSEDILRETLTCMMPDSADINDLIAHSTLAGW